MKMMLRRVAVFATLVTALAVCSPDTTSAPTPVAPPQASLIGDLTGTLTTTVSGVLDPLTCSTPGYGTVTKTIGNPGGTITVGPHSLTIPSGALGRAVEITMSAPKGRYIEVQFQPEGLVFMKETSLKMSYKDCGILVLNPKVTYVDDDHNVLEVLLSVPNLLGKTVTGKLKHFSGYAVAE